MYAVRKNRACELQFFGAYLDDRIAYARRLGLAKGPPRTVLEFLNIGSSLTLAQVDSLFASKINQPLVPQTSRSASDSQKVKWTGSSYSAGMQLETEFAEVYGTFRWNFGWREFTIVGFPDGLPANTVYEFKATKSQRWLNTTMKIASTQADLYGVFFDRPKKRVQVRVAEDGCLETLDAPVDRDNAIFTLERVRSVVRGEVPAPPEPFKCRRCELAEGCPIRQV